jgi:hypothetical protein
LGWFHFRYRKTYATGQIIATAQVAENNKKAETGLPDHVSPEKDNFLKNKIMVVPNRTPIS